MAWAKHSVVLVQIGPSLRVLSVGLRALEQKTHVGVKLCLHRLGLALPLQPSGVLSPRRRLRLPVARDHRPLERAGRVKGGRAGELCERTLDAPEHSSTLRFTTAVRDDSTEKRAPSACLDRLAVLVRFTQHHGEAYQNALGRHRPMMPIRLPIRYQCIGAPIRSGSCSP